MGSYIKGNNEYRQQRHILRHIHYVNRQDESMGSIALTCSREKPHAYVNLLEIYKKLTQKTL